MTQFGDASESDVGQFVVQAGGKAGNKERFSLGLTGTNPVTTHRFVWQPDSIQFQSYHGDASALGSANDLIHEWQYTGEDIPDAAGLGTPRINLWQFQNQPPSGEVEVVIRDFVFTVPEPSAALLLLGMGAVMLNARMIRNKQVC